MFLLNRVWSLGAFFSVFFATSCFASQAPEIPLSQPPTVQTAWSGTESMHFASQPSSNLLNAFIAEPTSSSSSVSDKNRVESKSSDADELRMQMRANIDKALERPEVYEDTITIKESCCSRRVRCKSPEKKARCLIGSGLILVPFIVLFLSYSAVQQKLKKYDQFPPIEQTNCYRALVSNGDNRQEIYCFTSDSSIANVTKTIETSLDEQWGNQAYFSGIGRFSCDPMPEAQCSTVRSVFVSSKNNKIQQNNHMQRHGKPLAKGSFFKQRHR